MISNPKYFPKEKFLLFTASAITVIFLVCSTLFPKTPGIFLWLLPPALLLVLLAFLSIDKFLLLTVFLIPLSIQLSFIIPETALDISLPTELMLAGILFLFLYKVLVTRETDRKILAHPVSVISFCLLGWYFVTSVTGTLPWISLKSFITRIWFFTAFYLLASEIFRKPDKIRSYFFTYIAGMVPVIIYFLVRMWHAGIFNQKASYSSIRPFFNDHTSFGASVAFCIPVILYFISTRKRSFISGIFHFALLLLFGLALVFSYSRAAWISLVVAALAAALMLLRISWKVILPASVLLAIFLLISWPVIVLRLNENKQESSSNIKIHLQSISNIRSDASNMERLNRWKCAIRMIGEKPLMGWGPATYQFQYAPYQMVSDKTIISTNQGDGGNAHSEYLGSMVDSGIPGLILYLALLIVTVRRGIIIWKTHSNKLMRDLTLALVTGLVTYAVHGALNNFLDTDKISALFWGMIAAIAAIDRGMKEERENSGLPEIGSDN